MEEALYRISGHESFPCRYTWLPKAVRGLDRAPKFFSDEEKAMVDMGGVQEHGAFCEILGERRRDGDSGCQGRWSRAHRFGPDTAW